MLNNRKHIKILLGVSAITVITALCIISAMIINTDRIIADKNEPDIDFSFVLKEYNGFLAVFRGSSSVPYIQLDTQVSFLNEYDRVLMKDGIKVSSEKDLRRAIEDFTS